jgi:hypothetical protein
MPDKQKAVPFGERTGSEPYNASEVLALVDSRRVVRRPIQSLDADVIDDIEGIENVAVRGKRFIFATSSLCLKACMGTTRRSGGAAAPSPSRRARRML